MALHSRDERGLPHLSDRTGSSMSYGENSGLLAAHGPEDRFGGALPDFREQGTTAAARRSAGIVSL